MCTVLLPPGDNPIAVNKYIIYHLPLKFIDIVLRYALQLLVCRLYLGDICIIPCYKEFGVA